jgi:Na+-transporting methylmalonyl-CoA/oxaloacetate decarboxylase gamma subunit
MKCPFSGYNNLNLCPMELGIALLFLITLISICLLIVYISNKNFKKETEHGRKRTKKADKAVRTHGD